MKKFLSTDDIKNIEKQAIKNHHNLMQTAAWSAAKTSIEIIKKNNNAVYGTRVLLFIGPGNNGGDGLYAGYFLQKLGVKCTCILISEDFHSDGFDKFISVGGQYFFAKDLSDLEMADFIGNSKLTIDAIYGLSQRLPLPLEILRTIDLINKFSFKILAIDLPSGIGGETHIKADETITFFTLKQEMLQNLDSCGTIKVNDLDITITYPNNAISELSLDELISQLPKPRINDNKYSSGITGIIAGSKKYPGAGILSVSGAVNTTSSMVKYFGYSHNYVINNFPEVVSSKKLDIKSKVNSWVIGPGLGEVDSKKYLPQILELDLPTVVDADAIIELNEYKKELKKRKKPLVITPHLGEFSRLLNKPIDLLSIMSPLEMIDLLKEISKDLNTTILLKGNLTLMVDNFGEVRVNKANTSWAATAGSGDVLSGIIGALLAASFTGIEAASCSALIHSQSAEISSKEFQPVLATDIAKNIRLIF